MSIKISAVKYWLHTCKWIISHVCISGWFVGFFLLLDFLLVIIWWNLIVIFQNLSPLCLISSKTWGNRKVWAPDCFIFWAHISSVWAVWKFICSLCSAGVLLSPPAFAVNVRKVISTYGAAQHQWPGQTNPPRCPAAPWDLPASDTQKENE